MTNEALEDEIVPIMNEFKVRPPMEFQRSLCPSTKLLGSRDMRRMLRQATIERVRGVLLCTEGCPTPYSSSLRLKRPRQCLP